MWHQLFTLIGLIIMGFMVVRHKFIPFGMETQVADPPAKERKFKTTPDGSIVMTEKELNDLLADVSEQALTALVKRMKLDQPANPPFSGTPEEQEGMKFNPRENETRVQRVKRINDAVTEIKGGKLRVEYAPKEVKFIRWCVAKAQKDHEVVEALGPQSWPNAKALTEAGVGTGAELIPIEFATDLKVAIEQYVAIGDCSQHEMTTNELDLRAVQTKPTVYQVGEVTAPTEAGTQFTKPLLTAKAFAGSQVISRELFQDNNVGLYDKLVVLFAEAFNARKSKELFKGGIAAFAPTSFNGIMKTATTSPIVLDSQNISGITYKKLVALNRSLSPGQLMNGGKYYMHRTILAQIEGITDLNQRPIVLNPWDDKGATLFGRPIILDEQMPSDPGADAASTPYIVFGNLIWADHGVRQEVYAQLSTEGVINSISLLEQRAYGLMIDTRWGIVVSLPENLRVLQTGA